MWCLWATKVKYHRLGGLETNVDFSRFWRLASPN